MSAIYYWKHCEYEDCEASVLCDRRFCEEHEEAMSETPGKKENIAVRVSPAMKKAIAIVAEARGLKSGEVIRRWIRDGLESEGFKHTPADPWRRRGETFEKEP